MRETVAYSEAFKRGVVEKAALADARAGWCLESALLGIACERLGTTAEE